MPTPGLSAIHPAPVDREPFHAPQPHRPATAFGGAGDGPEQDGVTGAEADLARAAALRATGGGAARAVERDTENGATWEVEVVRPDKTAADVRLDERYAVVVIESDGESGESGWARGHGLGVS